MFIINKTSDIENFKVKNRVSSYLLLSFIYETKSKSFGDYAVDQINQKLMFKIRKKTLIKDRKLLNNVFLAVA